MAAKLAVTMLPNKRRALSDLLTLNNGNVERAFADIVEFNHCALNHRKSSTLQRTTGLAISRLVHTFNGGQLLKDFQAEYKQGLKDEFSALRIAIMMDTSNSNTVNGQGIDSFRRLQQLSKRQIGIIPSRSSVFRVMNDIYFGASDFIRSELFDGGKGCRLNLKDALHALFNRFGPDDPSIPTTWSLAIDGAKKTEHQGYNLVALKLVCDKLIDRSTGCLKVEGKCYQALTNNIFIGYRDGDDGNKSTSSLAGNMLADVQDMERNGLSSTGNIIGEDPNVIRPMKWALTLDLKAAQTTCNKGCGSGGMSDMFCFLCACGQYNKAGPSPIKCRDCIASPKPYECTHHEVLDSSLAKAIYDASDLMRSIGVVVWPQSDSVLSVLLEFYSIRINPAVSNTAAYTKKAVQGFIQEFRDNHFIQDVHKIPNADDSTIDANLLVKGVNESNFKDVKADYEAEHGSALSKRELLSAIIIFSERMHSLTKVNKESNDTMLSPDDFDDSSIDDFQMHIDYLMIDLVAVYGREIVTNYFHYLRAGHFRYFLRRYRNIVKFANIGFEACNGVMRSFIHRRTQMGGHAGEGDKKCPTAKSILKYMVRRFVLCLAGKGNGENSYLDIDIDFVASVAARGREKRLAEKRQQTSDDLAVHLEDEEEHFVDEEEYYENNYADNFELVSE